MKRQLQIIFPSKYIYYYHSAFNYLLILCRTEKILINSGVAIAPPPKSVKKATAKSSAAANLSACITHVDDDDKQWLATSPTSTTTMITVCCVTHVNNNDDVGDAATVVSTNDGDNHLEPPSLYLFPSCTLCHKLILLLPFFILLKSLHISYQMNMESIYFYW